MYDSVQTVNKDRKENLYTLNEKHVHAFEYHTQTSQFELHVFMKIVSSEF